MGEPLLPSGANQQQREACFAEFYQAVHGRPPFAWQRRLAAEVLDPAKGWPDVVRVPTGCGKTSVLDIAVFELAVQASRAPGGITAARRICLVVDRKLIVDEATEHAANVRRQIVRAGDPGSILGRIAAALRAITPQPDGPSGEPLRVVRLRGGVYRDDGWAADPLTPTIIISTVDQIGSRILFRGYGVSRRSRAVHAGLLAFDTRIILDEAHLSTVFATTLAGREIAPNGETRHVAGINPYQDWAEQAVLPESRRLRFVRMSATAGTGENLFELSKAEREEAALRSRLEATKPAALIEVSVEAVKKQVRDSQPRVAREMDRKNREKLVDAMVKHASGLAVFKQDNEPDRPRVVGLVFNRVASARRAFESLCRSASEAGDASQATTPRHDVILLTGRIRPFDRDRLLEDWLPMIRAGRDAQPERPLFVVATQTVEVGANIDFDALVTEGAPLDALRQRFGRLRRIPDQPAGRPPAAAAVFIQSDHAKDSSTDPLYGQAVAETWKWLNAHASRPVGTKGKGKRAKKTAVAADPVAHPALDFASSSVDALLTGEDTKPPNLADLLAPQPDAPILFPAHLDAWVQTSPQPDPDPDVAPFLHGPGAGPADVQVVWRADLTPRNREHWAEIVALMPPRTREALAVPLHEARKWLQLAAYGDVADIEGASVEDSGYGDRFHVALRWRGEGRNRRGRSTSRRITPSQLRAGDTIVVPASYGGADEFGWHGRGSASAEPPVTDVADQCLAELVASYPIDAFRRPPLRLRLHPALMGTDPAQADARSNIRRTLSHAAWAAANDGDPLNDVRRALDAWPSLATAGDEGGACKALLANALRLTIQPYPDGEGVVVSARLTLNDGQRPIPEYDLEVEEPDDDRASILDGVQHVTLEAHTQAVRSMASVFARACALPDDLRAALGTAAFWHDQGKRDRRFQAWLHGSEFAAFVALAGGRVLAKSARQRGASAFSSERFGYPKGHRHEFVSARLFEEACAHDTGSPIPNADLVKFLIGTHHGRGRAFAPVSRDRHPVEVRMDHNDHLLAVLSDHALHTLDSGWTDLFWTLTRRYGWWGLAYLEALLITADRLVSSDEQRRDASDDAGMIWHESAAADEPEPAPAPLSIRSTR